jgi:hypothetical protein
MEIADARQADLLEDRRRFADERKVAAIRLGS